MIKRTNSMRVAVVLVLVGCGGATETESDEPCDASSAPPAPSVDASLGDAVAPLPDSGSVGPTINPRCVETDETIATCAAAGGPGSWTASTRCTEITHLGGRMDRPQKYLRDGGVIEREGSNCCKHYRVADGGAEALCCADLAVCLE